MGKHISLATTIALAASQLMAVAPALVALTFG